MEFPGIFLKKSDKKAGNIQTNVSRNGILQAE